MVLLLGGAQDHAYFPLRHFDPDWHATTCVLSYYLTNSDWIRTNFKYSECTYRHGRFTVKREALRRIMICSHPIITRFYIHIRVSPSLPLPPPLSWDSGWFGTNWARKESMVASPFHDFEWVRRLVKRIYPYSPFMNLTCLFYRLLRPSIF